jgi:mRNA interferase MazF
VPRAKRGEIWMADLGMAAKVRPVLVLSVAYEGQERQSSAMSSARPACAILSTKCVTKLVACRTEPSTRKVWASIPEIKLERRVGLVDSETLDKVEKAVRAWLRL